MNELRLVERIRRMAGATPGLIAGIGDDCAIYRPTSAEDLVFTTDQLIEGVHFLPELPAPSAGERALARSLSDIAAMGAEPRFCLVSLAVPAKHAARWVIGFYKGLLDLARQTGTALAGGDLAHSDKIHCEVTVCGSVARGAALRRSGARVGDSLWVSGKLGKPWDRRIQPRLELGRALVGRATACIDVSDGLALDLYRLCKESGVAARVDQAPLARNTTMEHALYGGEDYELLFTLPGGSAGPRGTTQIGAIVRGKAGAMRFQGRPLEPRGYDHFR